MKVLSIVSAGYEAGGAETNLTSYHKAFLQQGDDSRIISSDLRPDLPHYSDYEFKAIRSNAFSRLASSIFNLSAYRVTRRVLREFAPDVVVLHTMHQVTPAVLFLLRSYPTIQCVHGPEAFTSQLLPWYMKASWFKNEDYDVRKMTTMGRISYFIHRYPFAFLYRHALKNADRLLVFSKYMQHLIQSDGFDPAKITYIPCGVVSMSDLDPVSDVTESVISYAGRLEKYKGVQFLIEAMPDVLRRFPNARLAIAGEGSYAPRLRRQVRQSGLEDSVSFVGRLNNADLARLYASSVVVVMPSTCPETFGKVGVEAMSVGTPVIASDVGGIGDWLHHNENGILVPPGDPKHLAAAIDRVLGDPALHAVFSSNARKTAKEFSVDRHVDSLFAVVAEVMTQSRSNSPS
jgi:glycosyltransferase involved in cell wall biosynthesis